MEIGGESKEEKGRISGLVDWWTGGMVKWSGGEESGGRSREWQINWFLRNIFLP